jgi:peptidoglycan hydrolase-like protein with peptidoglycan-binding domain
VTTQDNKIIGILDKSIIVFDPQLKKIIYSSDLKLSPPIWSSLALGPDGFIYGVNKEGVISINPNTYEVKMLALFSSGITAGFVIKEDKLYFASKSHIVEYTLPLIKPLSLSPPDQAISSKVSATGDNGNLTFSLVTQPSHGITNKANDRNTDSNISTVTIDVEEKMISPVQGPVGGGEPPPTTYVQTPNSPTVFEATSPTTISSTLSFGSRGPQVTLLQKTLVKEKLLTSNLATGYYGTLTELAVKQLQKKYNIVSSGTPKTTGYGVVGKKTMALVNSLNTNSSTTPNPSTSLGVNNQTTTSGSKITVNLSIGSRNPQVKTLQTILVQQNLLSPKYVTGYYGPITQTAVQKLQSKYNVVSTGTPKTTGYGVVGPKTRKVVNSI